MSVSKEQVVLEEVLRAAINAAREARARAVSDLFEEGLMMAYYDLITVAKEQAELMELEFIDRTIAEFDPDELLRALKTQSAA